MPILWSPIAVSNVRADGKTGWGFAVSINLLREPLKPFPILLRTCAFSFVFDVTAQLAPRDAHCSPQQLIDRYQRNHARKYRIAQRLEDTSNGLYGLKKTRIGFDF